MQNFQKAQKAHNSHLFKRSIQSKYLDRMSLLKDFYDDLAWFQYTFIDNNYETQAMGIGNA